ncbi:AAA family ATPase [Mucilaginibacter sp. AW1-7]|uniref:AAA family ATPase n=1 Tax=Mucilaginibacter sp. AW1-7 TaxID=3349874 RepID=UPI003F73FCEF
MSKNYHIDTYKDQEQIKVIANFPPEIYNVGKIDVHISAIVGKNGAGKSSLVELLYVALYNLSRRLRLTDKEDEEGVPYTPEANINVEIYYRLKGRFFKITSIGNFFHLTQFNNNGRGFQASAHFNYREQLAELFYTIVINYSMYGLNSREVGHWIKSIFHKNDSYQTPVVLNPYRSEGNININSENYLAKARLLTNLLSDGSGILYFKNNVKTAKKAVFTMDASKFQVNKKSGEIVFPNSNDLSHRIFPVLFEIFFNEPGFQVSNDIYLQRLAKEYIIRKLKSIAQRYKQYRRFPNFFGMHKSELLRKYIETLYADHSHITFKLRQAINFLKFDIIPKDKENFELPIGALAASIKTVQDKHDIPTIELLPPSFFAIDIEFSNSEDRMEKLSSGEKQKIYALSSLVYHLRNLDSVKEYQYQRVPTDTPTKLVKYQHINIIFDEVELYYHPDLQRRFIKDLLASIAAARLKSIRSINLLFITHSPFILSDIPEEHTLYLDVREGRSLQVSSETKTFGGNIHDLLANSFFLDTEGYMGEFAKEQIESAINYLMWVIQRNQKNKPATRYPKWDQIKVRRFIDMLGEPLIKTSLNELYTQAFLLTPDEIDKEISRLQAIKAAKLDKV